MSQDFEWLIIMSSVCWQLTLGASDLNAVTLYSIMTIRNKYTISMRSWVTRRLNARTWIKNYFVRGLSECSGHNHCSCDAWKEKEDKGQRMTTIGKLCHDAIMFLPIFCSCDMDRDHRFEDIWKSGDDRCSTLWPAVRLGKWKGGAGTPTSDPFDQWPGSLRSDSPYIFSPSDSDHQ